MKMEVTVYTSQQKKNEVPNYPYLGSEPSVQSWIPDFLVNCLIN